MTKEWVKKLWVDVSEEFNGYVFRITGGNDKQYVLFLFLQ